MSDLFHGLWSFVSSLLLDLTGCQVKNSLQAILFNILKPHTVSHYDALLMLLTNLVFFLTLRNQAKHEFLKGNNNKALYIYISFVAYT